VIQHGQVFKLKAKGADRQPLWHTATGSRVAARRGPRSAASQAAQGEKALRKVPIGSAQVEARRRSRSARGFDPSV
jgi:hypothetical protein